MFITNYVGGLLFFSSDYKFWIFFFFFLHIIIKDVCIIIINFLMA